MAKEAENAEKKEKKPVSEPIEKEERKKPAQKEGKTKIEESTGKKESQKETKAEEKKVKTGEAKEKPEEDKTKKQIKEQSDDQETGGKPKEKRGKETEKEIVEGGQQETQKKGKKTKSESVKTKEQAQEDKKGGKSPKETEKTTGNRGIVHIYSSKNNTLVHITDITGAETISRVTGGMVSKADRLKGAPYQGMLVAQRAVEEAKNKGIKEVDIRMRAPGAHRQMNMGRGAQPAIKAILQSGLKANVIEDVTPIIHGSMKKKGGRRGRRL